MKPQYPKPTRRRLKIYATDPQAGDSPGNKVTIDIPFERLLKGPAGSVVEVIDYDSNQKAHYVPVDLERLETLIDGGLAHDEGDPRFHQQMVYAVSMRVIESFTQALGRPVRFSRPGKGYQPLRLVPHAFEQANAYFDPDLHAVLFGYFKASENNFGHNLPGQIVFTCLSYDIVAHEITHAILHRLRHYFMYPCNADSQAFHEGFADIVAIFQRLTFREVVKTQIANFRGDVASGNLGDLATQFGAALGKDKALRSAIDEQPPDPTKLARTYEPHARGAILLAAVFDTFVRIYEYRTRDLLRIATGGSGVLPEGRLHPDLVERLTSEAIKTAQSLLNMCIRAIDYLPPVDVTFSDFLRAIVTSDSELVREDKFEQLEMLIEAFRQRGIYPEDAVSLAPKSVRYMKLASNRARLPRQVVQQFWRALSLQRAVERERQYVGRSAEIALSMDKYNTVINFDIEDDIGAKIALSLDDHDAVFESRPDGTDDGGGDAREEDRNAKHRLAVKLWKFADGNRALLGLRRDLPIQVHGFHTNLKISPSQMLRAEFIISYTQVMSSADEREDFGGMPVVGGTTVVADAEGRVQYVVAKPLPNAVDKAHAKSGQQRIAAQEAYVAELDARDPALPWASEEYLKKRMIYRATFRALHGQHPAHGHGGGE